MSWFFTTVVVPILVIGFLIFVHELGHFLVAKWCNVGVVKFSIGFGPSIWKKKYGETTYQLSIIPLGGYVRMVGDMPDPITGSQSTDEAVRAEEKAEDKKADEEISPELLADRSRWFVEKSLFQRSSIVFAGPLFNFISAVFLIALAAGIYGKEDVIEAPVIGGVMKGNVAERAGILPGDEVLAVNGKPVAKWDEVAESIHNSEGAPLALRLKRGAEQLEVTVEPKESELPIAGSGGENKKVYLIGIERAFKRTPLSMFEAVPFGVEWTAVMSQRTLEGLFGMISGHVSPKELAGPLFILDAAGQTARMGFEQTLKFMALLSVSLAVLNLLPIPVLDGGHLLFFFVEALLGPISMKKKELAQTVGLLFLLLIMGVAISNDIQREPPPKENDNWNRNSTAPE